MENDQNIRDNQTARPEIPGEEDLQAMLAAFQPAPGARFYSRMANSPWTAGGDRGTRLAARRRSRLALAFVSGVVIGLLALGALAIPSVRATAQRIALYFLRSDSDRSTVTVTPQSSGVLEYTFAQTLAEAAAQAGFPVHEPSVLPAFLHLNGAVYLPEIRAVILDYRTEESNQVMRLTQQWVGNNESIASIGASAEVETVKIGEYTGEYVSGGWRHPGLATPLANAAPGMQITLEARWDPESGIQILRWQQGDMLFEILNIHANPPLATDLSKEDLVAIAGSMQ